MNGVRWDLLKVALKSPYVVLIGLFTVSMAVATAVMLGGTLYLTFDRMVAVLGSEFFGSSRLIIPLIVFFSLQRYFVRGLLAGSTKG